MNWRDFSSIHAEWLVHEVVPHLELHAVREMPNLSGSIEAELDRLWRLVQSRSGGALFNGRVFTADQIAPDYVMGHWTEYRRIVGQFERPDLFETLRLRPMAVGGAIMGPDGVVFGLRPDHAVYQPGMWQLPPAGNLDLSCAGANGKVDFLRHILTELLEEMGMGAEAVSVGEPLCLVEHPHSHVMDLGIALQTDLDEAAIRKFHSSAVDAEYGIIRFVKPFELAAFMAAESKQITPQTWAFLAKMGLLN